MEIRPLEGQTHAKHPKTRCAHSRRRDGALFAPATALAAAPKVTTGGVALITQNGGKLKGKVDPNGTATTYIFQFGTTKLYGAQTRAAGRRQGQQGQERLGRRELARAGDAVPLPARRPSAGTGFRRARTARSRPSRSRSACRSPRRRTRSGSAGATTLAGMLSGTGNASARSSCRRTRGPTRPGSRRSSTTRSPTPTGAFSFTVLPVDVNTQYRVLMPASRRS